MSILIDINVPGWMEDAQLRDQIAPMLPGVTLHCGIPNRTLPDVTVLATSRLGPGRVRHLPNLQLVQKLGAGVDTMAQNPELPDHIRIARMAPDIQAREIAEYCLTYVMAFQRNLFRHLTDQRRQHWQAMAPGRTEQTTVAALGLGHIGGRTAKLFAELGFRVVGWSRTPKAIDRVETHAGMDALPAILDQADYVVAILPSTQSTRGLFDAERLGWLKPGAVILNAGRGDLIDEQALLAALDGPLGHAVLDVMPVEPLSQGHPFWDHPKITLTPHVSGWHLDGGFETVAENYRRLADGRPLLNEVDRQAGY